MSAIPETYRWDDDSDDIAPGDVLIAVAAVAVAALIVARRGYLLYLGHLMGDLWALWWTVPIMAVASAVVAALWALLRGGVHLAAVPLLSACTAILAAGAVAWEVTM